MAGGTALKRLKRILEAIAIAIMQHTCRHRRWFSHPLAAHLNRGWTEFEGREVYVGRDRGVWICHECGRHEVFDMRTPPREIDFKQERQWPSSWKP